MVKRDYKSPELDDRSPSVSEEEGGVGGGVGTVVERGEELTARIIDSKAEKALCRRFDFRLLPVLAVMYLFNALDKGNLGNAKTNGFEKDLGFTGNQYNILLSVFYVPYVLCAAPVGMLGKKYGPSGVLPILMFMFGSMTLLGAACKNFGGMMTVRVILGAAESAFFPLVIYYLTTFYRRGELARRLAIFYAASLLAFGVFHIKSHLPAWRYLFIIEGSCTALFSFFAYWHLPLSAAKARFLSPEEKELAFYRIQVDSSSVVDEKFDLKESIKVFKMPVAWAWLAIEMCLGVPLQSVSLFLPQIVGRLGYSVVKTNLYTVAPNITGAVMLLILAFTSDFTRLRSPFIALGFSFPLIGFIIYASIDVLHDKQIAYFATFMMCWGTSAPSVLLSTWYNNNIAHEGKRVVLTSVGVPVANMMGVVSSNIFRAQDAPNYIPALITTACFGAVGMLLAGSLGIYMVFDNRKRNRVQGVDIDARDVATKVLKDGSASPNFRWFL
ncbi:MFS general substrate transporter [Choiromyces venosus 120613-1]|uniref:MFS general substrate transporter n=1 Tax=Choiromyces venosus 120613-1 TaxID=1336337 RepID=A0A3N4JIU1_9PEZI|nr:MFS general substrate transporter [Choiromyces venosus 120613-1]